MNKIVTNLTNEIYKELDYNLKDFGLGLDKGIKIKIFKPTPQLIVLTISISALSFFVMPFVLCQFIWFIMGIYFINKIISVHPLSIFNFETNDCVISFWEKLFKSIEFTPRRRYQFIMFSILTVLCLLPTLIRYLVFTFFGTVLGFCLYKRYCNEFLDWIQNPDPKRTSKIVYFIVFLIYVVDLLVVYNITASVFKLFETNVGKKEQMWLSMLDISLNLRIHAKYKWIMCAGCTIVWSGLLIKSIFTIEYGFVNLIWLILSTLKFSYRFDLDIFLEILKKNATIEKAKEIAWENAGKIPTLMWTSIKSNMCALLNDPIGWYTCEGLSFQGVIDKINAKEKTVMKFTYVLNTHKTHYFTRMFSKYYFMLSPITIFLTTLYKCKNNSLEIFILPIIITSYLLNTCFCSDFTKIDFEDRLTYIVDSVKDYTKKKLCVVKGIIQTTYTTKSTAGGTLNGGITGGIIGMMCGSLISGPFTGGGSLLGAGIGSIYCGYLNYKQSNLICIPELESIRKFQEFVKTKETKSVNNLMIEMKEINNI